jgi:hypothetical protein
MTKSDVTILLTRTSGLTLFTLALLAVPKALGAIVSLVYAVVSYGAPSYSCAEDKDSLEILTVTLYGEQAGNAITSLCTAVILFLLARWLLKGPKLLKRWMGEDTNI